MTDRDRQIRDLAYRIWEEAGRPTGQEDRHWSEAERRYAAQGAKAKPDKGDAGRKGGKASKLSPDAARDAKLKPNEKPARGSSNAGPAKSKGRGKAKG